MNSTTRKAYSFSSSFALAVVPEYPKIGGHGMAFTIATTKYLKGSPLQYLGLLNSSVVGNFFEPTLSFHTDLSLR